MKKLLTFLGLAATALVSNIQAQSLLAWDVNGVAATNTLTANTIAANLSTTSGLNQLTRVGVLSSSTTNSYASTNWNTTSVFDEGARYVSFTLQADAGYEMTLTSLDSVVWGSNTAPKTARWGYRIGTGSFVLSDTFDLTSSATGASRVWNFNDFTTSEAVEFRFWAYGTNSINNTVAAASGSIRVPGNASTAGNDLVLNGSVALIPEPSTYALLTLAAAGLGGYAIRRRRR